MQKFLVDQLFNEEVFFLLGGDYFFVSHFLSDFAELNVSVGVEILLTKLCNLEETFQRVLGYDWFEFCFFNFGLILLGLLIKNRSSISNVHGFLPLEFVFEGLTQTALSVWFTHFVFVNKIVYNKKDKSWNVIIGYNLINIRVGPSLKLIILLNSLMSDAD